MHARVEHLLSLRDGEPVDVAVRAHVEGCARCSTALAELTAVRGRLKSLPPVAPATQVGWHAVLARRSEREAFDRLRVGVTRAAVAASVAVIGVAVAWRMTATPPVPIDARTEIAVEAVAQAVSHDRLAQLQSQSAALEDMLDVLGERPAVERAGAALPIDTLEAQVQWIDHQLFDGADTRDAERLWRERVQTMNSLVRLRVAEARRVETL
jgi:hypothetical protein